MYTYCIDCNNMIQIHKKDCVYLALTFWSTIGYSLGTLRQSAEVVTFVNLCILTVLTVMWSWFTKMRTIGYSLATLHQSAEVVTFVNKCMWLHDYDGYCCREIILVCQVVLLYVCKVSHEPICLCVFKWGGWGWVCDVWDNYWAILYHLKYCSCLVA